MYDPKSYRDLRIRWCHLSTIFFVLSYGVGVGVRLGGGGVFGKGTV